MRIFFFFFASHDDIVGKANGFCMWELCGGLARQEAGSSVIDSDDVKRKSVRLWCS